MMTATKTSKTPWTDAYVALVAANAAAKAKDQSAKAIAPDKALLIKAAIEGCTQAERELVVLIGRGKDGWAIVCSMDSGNKRPVYGRYRTLKAAHAARQGAAQIVVAADNIAEDDEWVWGDTRHVMVSSEGWTSVVPA